MSAAASTPPAAKKLGIGGIAIVIFALIYELMGWTFLNTVQPSNIQVYGDDTQTNNHTYYKVIKVTDGDTLRVDVNGTDVRVRLIGINTPETVDPRSDVQCFGKEASERMAELASGKRVRLENDPTQDLYDTYGRLLAYAYLEDGQMLNRKMIAEGYAYEYTYLKEYAYQSEFRDLQNLARTSGRGLWSAETCSGKTFF